MPCLAISKVCKGLIALIEMKFEQKTDVGMIDFFIVGYRKWNLNISSFCARKFWHLANLLIWHIIYNCACFWENVEGRALHTAQKVLFTRLRWLVVNDVLQSMWIRSLVQIFSFHMTFVLVLAFHCFFSVFETRKAIDDILGFRLSFKLSYKLIVITNDEPCWSTRSILQQRWSVVCKF